MGLGASAAEANCGHQSRSPNLGDHTGAQVRSYKPPTRRANRYLSTDQPVTRSRSLLSRSRQPGQPGSRSSTPGRGRADRSFVSVPACLPQAGRQARSAQLRRPPHRSRCSDGCRQRALCGPRRRSPSGAQRRPDGVVSGAKTEPSTTLSVRRHASALSQICSSAAEDPLAANFLCHSDPRRSDDCESDYVTAG